MTKNVIIGILAVGIIIVGGYYLLKNNAGYPGAAQTTTSASKVSTPGAPVVGTNSSTFVSSSTVVVNGTVKPNGSSTSYWFEYGETTGLGSRTVSQQVGSGYSSTSTPAYITGLQANTIYYFRLSASNGFATVNGNTVTFKTNNNPPVPGSAPTTRTTGATKVTRNDAIVNGTINPNGWQTNFWFEYGTDTNLGNTTILQQTDNGSSTIPASIYVTGLNPLTKYYFRLNAQNQYGTVNGTILSFTTSGSSAASAPSVTTTSASNVTSSAARMNGNINPNGAETNYWFEYSQDSLLGTILGSGSTMQTISASNNSVDVQQNIGGLNRNTTYYYHLVGRNSYGTVNGSIMSFKTRN